jgi:hypothetical protein
LVADAGLDNIPGNTDDAFINEMYDHHSAVNDNPPTMDTISNVTIPEDRTPVRLMALNDEQSFQLTGITPGRPMKVLSCSATRWPIRRLWASPSRCEHRGRNALDWHWHWHCRSRCALARQRSQSNSREPDSRFPRALALARNRDQRTSAIPEGLAIVTGNSVAMTINIRWSVPVILWMPCRSGRSVPAFDIDYNSRILTATFNYTPGRHQFGGPVTVTTETQANRGLFVATEMMPTTRSRTTSLRRHSRSLVLPVNDVPQWM